jgi:hypothetical protein
LNKDIFRKHAWKSLDDVTKAKIFEIKDKADDLLAAIESFPLEGEALRHCALAKTNLEQAVMWAIKAITE